MVRFILIHRKTRPEARRRAYILELECYERKQQMTKINTISADPHMLPDTVS